MKRSLTGLKGPKDLDVVLEVVLEGLEVILKGLEVSWRPW